MATGDGGSVPAEVTIQVEQDGPQVSIDIKPGDAVNSINPKSNGKIPVAILSSATFDATVKVEISSLTFGHLGTEKSLSHCGIEKVNADALPDLMCHFNTQVAAFQPDSTVGRMKGKIIGGGTFEATDAVRIVK
jgi:hypothetical protein